MTDSLAKTMSDTSEALFRANQAVLELPFDVVRANYVSAVKLGVVQRSMLASMRFERGVRALERLVLGPMARAF